MGKLTNLSQKIRNSATDRTEKESQARPIKNTSGGSPKATGVSAPRNAVNRPNQ